MTSARWGTGQMDKREDGAGMMLLGLQSLLAAFCDRSIALTALAVMLHK